MKGFGSTEAARLGASPAVSLLANHEQEPPSGEQPLSQYRGGEEQGEAPGLAFATCFHTATKVIILSHARLQSRRLKKFAFPACTSLAGAFHSLFGF